MNETKPISMMDCTTAYAVPGADHMIDVINPRTGKSWINGETLEFIRLRYPAAEIVNIDEWCAAKGARQDMPIVWTETTEEKYWEMLEVLPPAARHSGGFLVGEPWDHHAVSGRARFAAYRELYGGKFYTANRPLTVAEFNKEMESKAV